MKFIKLFLLIFVLNYNSISAQSVENVFNTKEMTWYGIDFSMARFVGDFSQFSGVGIKSGNQIHDVYFMAWNQVIITEKEKYNLLDFYKKESILIDLTNIENLNNKVDPDSIVKWEKPKALSAEKIQEAVSKYDNKGKSGLALVFIIESFDKITELGTIHVTFFDLATNKVLLTKRLQTEPNGFGLRNYWVSTVYAAMGESKKKWNSWKKEASVKK